MALVFRATASKGVYAGFMMTCRPRERGRGYTCPPPPLSLVHACTQRNGQTAGEQQQQSYLCTGYIPSGLTPGYRIISLSCTLYCTGSYCLPCITYSTGYVSYEVCIRRVYKCMDQDRFQLILVLFLGRVAVRSASNERTDGVRQRATCTRRCASAGSCTTRRAASVDVCRVSCIVCRV